MKMSFTPAASAFFLAGSNSSPCACMQSARLDTTGFSNSPSQAPCTDMSFTPAASASSWQAPTSSPYMRSLGHCR